MPVSLPDSSLDVPEQLELPLHAWDEGMELEARDGSRLRRWGSVGEMSRVLFGLERRACYYLIERGEVVGFKLGKASNSHYRVDLVSVWEYRQREFGR